MNIGKHRLAGFLAGMAAVAGAWPHSSNPYSPPSQKPEHLRDAEDNRKLQLARERQMKGRR